MRLTPIPAERRAAIAAGPRDRAAHAALLAKLPLGALAGEPDAARGGIAGPSLRAVAWNLARCRDVEGSAALLAAARPDVVLLSEMDWGMARSGQRHTARDLASALGMSWAFGAEFLELDLGGARERAEHAGSANAVGFHGNAIAARAALQRPRLARLETRGDWFDGARGERRVGGRCALLAQVELAGRRLTLASVHLESHGTRDERADEMRALVEAIDAYDRDAPVLVGGDLNSFSLALAEVGDPGRVGAALRDDPHRWADPVAHEPLFAVAAEAGFAWADANALRVPTLRHATPEGSARSALKLDWFLCRGLAPSEPAVLEAVAPSDGALLSDHEAIAVSVAFAAP
ncbi:MAG: endonuclease [Proteobacteria bacterium]|nr:MAG: endonuclease [Pseudomonadota bacterium]